MDSLFYAIEHDDEVMLKQMLKDNYSLKVKNTDGYYPFTFALSLGRTRCLRILMNYGANPHDYRPFDSLEYAIRKKI